MATYNSVDAFTKAMSSYSDNCGKNANKLIRNASFTAVNIMRAELLTATGGDNMLSGTAKRTRSGVSNPRKLGVRFDMTKRAEFAPSSIIAANGSAGPWSLIDPTLTRKGIPPHIILPIGLGRFIAGRGNKRARDQRRKSFSFTILRGEAGTFAGLRPLRTPAGARYAVYDHPGVPVSRMPQPWVKGRARAERAVDRYLKSLWTTLPTRKSFGL